MASKNADEISPVYSPLPRAPQRPKLDSGDTRAAFASINRKRFPTPTSAPTGRTPLPVARRPKTNVGNTGEVVNPINEDACTNPVFPPIQTWQRATESSDCLVVNKGNALSRFNPVNASATKHVSQNPVHPETKNTLDSPAVINKVHTSVSSSEKSCQRNKTPSLTDQDKCIELNSGVPYGADVTEEQWKRCLRSTFHLKEKHFEIQETRPGYAEDPGNTANEQSWRVVAWRLINRSPKKALTLKQIYELGNAWCEKPKIAKTYNSCRHALTNAPELIQQHGCKVGWWYIATKEECRKLRAYDQELNKRERNLERPRREAPEHNAPPISRSTFGGSTEGAKNSSEDGPREGSKHTAEEDLRRHPANTQNHQPSSSLGVLNIAQNPSPRTTNSGFQLSIDPKRGLTKKHGLEPSVDIETASEKQNDRGMEVNPAKRQQTESSHKMSLNFLCGSSDRPVSLKYSADGVLLSSTDPGSKPVFLERTESNNHDATTDTASNLAYRWLDPEGKELKLDRGDLEAAASLMSLSRDWNSVLKQDAEEVPTKQPSPRDSAYATSPLGTGKMVVEESPNLALCSQATGVHGIDRGFRPAGMEVELVSLF
jgi:hypothetical protein